MANMDSKTDSKMRFTLNNDGSNLEEFDILKKTYKITGVYKRPNDTVYYLLKKQPRKKYQKNDYDEERTRTIIGSYKKSEMSVLLSTIKESITHNLEEKITTFINGKRICIAISYTEEPDDSP